MKSFLLKSQESFWNISPEVAIFLNLLIKDRSFQKVLEIGSSNGYSGIWLAEALSKTNGKLYSIESHKKRFTLAKENFQKSGLSSHITQIFGHAPEDIPLAPKFFDMAFFDATKYEHQSYFEKIENRIKKGGLIITDNAISHKKELSTFFKTLESKKNWKSELLNIGTGLHISQKL